MSEFNEIADRLHDILIKASAEDTTLLLSAMTAYQNKFPRTIFDLRCKPGFHKLWGAMLEACTANQSSRRGMVTRDEAIVMLAKCEMKPFTSNDWEMFSGCESKHPMLGQCGEYVVVLDGKSLLVVHSEDENGGYTFNL